LLQENEENIEAEVFNSVGTLVKVIDLYQSTQVNVSSLSSGLYIIRIKNKRYQAVKFVKQ
jgi:hypothetical protein